MVAVNGVRLNCVQMPPPSDAPDAPHLVMVHGLATNMAFWYFQHAPEFARRFRVTLFDLRGHGRSQMTDSGYTPANLGRDLAGLLDALGIAQAHFIAHSFGGVATLNLACEQPQRVASLVLADTHLSAVRHHSAGASWAYQQELQRLVEAHQLPLDTTDPYFGYKLLTEVARWQQHNQAVPEGLRELVSPFMGQHGNRTAMQWLKLMDSTHAQAELMGDDGLSLTRLRALNLPILAIYGDRSQARLTGEALLSVWPQAEFVRVPEAGHFFPQSRPQVLTDACWRFWNSLPQPRRTPRAGEPERPYFRSDRLLQVGDAWYAMSREQARIGPFASREAAQQGLADFIAALATEASSEKKPE